MPSVKNALKTTIVAQMVTEEVLRTVLTEIEGILNSKPLGYVSSDVTDVDPVTPSTSPDFSRRQWRHAQIFVTISDHFWRHFNQILPLNASHMATGQARSENDDWGFPHISSALWLLV